jgi:ribose-phosphate pyrophosphokinase
MAQQIPVIFDLGNQQLMNLVGNKLPADTGQYDSRSFPDGESYLRIESNVEGRQCIVIAELTNPDHRFLLLIFFAVTLRELGADSVGLVAPYLCYMRQDRRFKEGEAITSGIFAGLLSEQFDWLVTVDPHLHRYHSLDQIYTIPAIAVKGAPVITEWLKSQSDVFLVGPDLESEQWVSEIAAHSGHRFVIGRKQRYGDRNVKVSLPDLSDFQSMTAVIVDDVISSGHTILECVKILRSKGVSNIVCICVHGIFADNSDKLLLQSGLQGLISSNTVPHDSAQLDVSELLIKPIKKCLQFKSKKRS